MPDSGPADPGPDAPAGAEGSGEGTGGPPERELSELEEALDRLLRRYVELQDRVAEAEETRAAFEDVLASREPGELEAEEAVKRFRELAEENRRLRSLIEEGRERAKRIRSRLIMMEDEL